jgi:transcription elongation factor GreA
MDDESQSKSKRISIGDTVKIRLGNGEIKSYTVVSSDKTDPVNGFISNMCPIGRAVIGAVTGERKKYTVHGEESEIEILEIVKPR